jgi:hypothetical protein
MSGSRVTSTSNAPTLTTHRSQPRLPIKSPLQPFPALGLSTSTRLLFQVTKRNPLPRPITRLRWSHLHRTRAVLTASVLALLAYIGGPTVPQLVPGSYNIASGLVPGTESVLHVAPLGVLLRQESTVSEALTTDKVVCSAPAKWWCSTTRPLSLQFGEVQLSADTPTAIIFAPVSQSEAAHNDRQTTFDKLFFDNL